MISGPVNIDATDTIKVINVTSAEQMHQSVMQKIRSTDIFISAAAVADFKVHKISEEKIKKSDNTQKLVLENTLDILSQVATLNDAPFTVGFAAETENVEINAQKKMHSKNLDMIAANKVGENIGIDSEENALTVFWKTGSEQLPLTSKNKLARQLIKIIALQYNEKNSNQTH